MAGRIPVLVLCLLAMTLVPACGGDGGDENGGGTGTASSGNPADAGKLRSAVDGYYAGMKAGDVDGVFQLMAPKLIALMEQQLTYLGENPKEALAESWKNAAPDLTYEVLEENFDQMVLRDEIRAKAVVKVVVSGVEDRVEFWFLKKDDKWLIEGLDSRNTREEAERGMEEAERDRKAAERDE